MSCWRGFGVVAMALAGVASSSAGFARDEVPGVLFQGGTVVPPPVVEVDPELPVGHRNVWQDRPSQSTRAETSSGGRAAVHDGADAPEASLAERLTERACDAAYPVCVHGSSSSERAKALGHLARAFRVWNYVLRMPAPLGDGGLGGGPELDVYLTQDPDADLHVEHDPPLLLSDRISVWCEVGARALTERRAAECIAEASGAALDAAESPGVRQGWANHRLDAAYLPAKQTFDSIALAQAHPSQPVLTRERSPRSAAAGSFWAYLDDTLGVGAAGRLPLVLMRLSMAAHPSEDPHPEWRNVPDVLDVLRHAYGTDASRLSLLWSNWSVSRAFWGNRATTWRPQNGRWLGDAARIALDWVVDYSSLPRHLAGPRPIYPTGAAYVWVNLDSVPLNAVLAVRAEWEAPTPFRWAVVSVDAQGKEVKRWSLPYLENATMAETTLVNFHEAAGLLVVGTNLGAVDVSHPFDPDQEPWEPHGYTVYLTELGAGSE